MNALSRRGAFLGAVGLAASPIITAPASVSKIDYGPAANAALDRLIEGMRPERVATWVGAHPDAALIAACAEFTRLELLVGKVLNAAVTLEECRAADAEANRLWDLQDQHLEAVCGTRPQTPAGAKAVYLAATLWLDVDASDDPDGCKDNRLRAAAHRAALAGFA